MDRPAAARACSDKKIRVSEFIGNYLSIKKGQKDIEFAIRKLTELEMYVVLNRNTDELPHSVRKLIDAWKRYDAIIKSAEKDNQHIISKYAELQDMVQDFEKALNKATDLEMKRPFDLRHLRVCAQKDARASTLILFNSFVACLAELESFQAMPIDCELINLFIQNQDEIS